MTTHVLDFTHTKVTNRAGFIIILLAYGLVLSFLLSRAAGVMEIGSANELKIWILAAVMSSMMALVVFFLKRLLDSFDKSTQDVRNELRELNVQLKNHDSHIASILTTLGYHKEKIEWLRNRVIEREK